MPVIPMIRCKARCYWMVIILMFAQDSRPRPGAPPPPPRSPAHRRPPSPPPRARSQHSTRIQLAASVNRGAFYNEGALVSRWTLLPGIIGHRGAEILKNNKYERIFLRFTENGEIEFKIWNKEIPYWKHYLDVLPYFDSNQKQNLQNGIHNLIYNYFLEH